MADMLIILIVLSAVAVYYYGVRAFTVIVFSVFICAVSDMLCLKLCKKKFENKDISAIITGIEIALMMPSSIPYHILSIACIFSIVIGKHAFGGRGHAIFNCAAVGFLFAALNFPDFVLSYPKPFTALAITETVNPMDLYPSMTRSAYSTGTSVVPFMDLVIGKFNGPMGCSCTIVLIIAAVILMYRRAVSVISFITQTAVVFVITLVRADFDAMYAMHILSGGMFIFGILFLSCDYSTIPKARVSRMIYGFTVAMITRFFCFYAKVENAIVYAVIIAAPIGIELDRRSFSLADMLEKDHGIMFSIKKKFNKNLSSVSETLNLVNDGSDKDESTARITIHSRDEGIFPEETDL